MIKELVLLLGIYITLPLDIILWPIKFLLGIKTKSLTDRWLDKTL